jgi:hypothetical protein
MALYHQVKTVADSLREEILSVISPEEQAQTAGCWKNCSLRLRRSNAPAEKRSVCATRMGAPKSRCCWLTLDPFHSTPKRIAYGIVGLLVCLTGRWVMRWSPPICKTCRAFAAWSTEIAWLPAVYVMTNVSINLLLVKFRQQFGLRAFTEGFLVLYVLVTFFHLFVNDLSFGDDGARRPRHGRCRAQFAWDLLSGAGLACRHRLKALTIGITGSSLAIPIARLFSTELLQLDEWRGLYFSNWGWR